MFIPLGIKTDYELLDSLIKLPDLITFLKEKNIKALGIIDNNLSYVMEASKLCFQNDIKLTFKQLLGLTFKDISLTPKNQYLVVKYNLS